MELEVITAITRTITRTTVATIALLLLASGLGPHSLVRGEAAVMETTLSTRNTRNITL